MGVGWFQSPYGDFSTLTTFRKNAPIRSKPAFQSPCGDFGTLTLFPVCASRRVAAAVSVPLRGFWYADKPVVEYTSIKFPSFQSPYGDFGNATPRLLLYWRPSSRLSPLTGILVTQLVSFYSDTYRFMNQSQSPYGDFGNATLWA